LGVVQFTSQSREVSMSETVSAPESESTQAAGAIPKWVDLASPDLARSSAYYAALFGWEVFVQPGEESGGYLFFLHDGKSAAGGGPTMSPEQPSAWATYVYVADAEATVEAVKTAGGTVMMGPFDVMGQGIAAYCIDPEGAYFAIWQPLIHQGAEHMNAPGGFCWNELNTRNVEGAKAFYGQVFGWEVRTSDNTGASYTEFLVDGRSIAGCIDITNVLPAEIPANWLVYFAVANADETVAKSLELGGATMMGPTDIPDMGRFAVITDPVGAVFAVMQFGG
jgi:uncharacterized protein